MVKLNFLNVWLIHARSLKLRSTFCKPLFYFRVGKYPTCNVNFRLFSTYPFDRFKYAQFSSVENEHHSSASFLSIKQFQILQKRFMPKKRRKNELNDDSDSDSDRSDEEYPEDVHFEADRELPNNYTEKKVQVSSLRIDALLSRGLNVGRSKVDDHFLESKLRVNGERLLKKSKFLEEGDSIDSIHSSEDGKTKFSRVRVVLVTKNTTKKGKLVVYLRIWKNVLEEK